MNKEEFLIEAKRRYPVGTKYRNAHDYSSNEPITAIDSKIVWQGNEGMYFSEVGGLGWLYYRGKWAEVIELPKGVTITDNYSVW